MAETRFRIDLEQSSIDATWSFTVWDFADHGEDLAYAKGSDGTLDGCLATASHYVLMAEQPPFWRPAPKGETNG